MGGAARATSGGFACWVAGTAWCGTGISGIDAERSRCMLRQLSSSRLREPEESSR